MKELNKQINRACFSPGNDCLNAILDSITTAEYSLKICVFTISDDRITAAIKQAHASGIEVKLLTDNEKLFDKGSDIRELAAAGIETRVDVTQNHMHHKFALIDNEALLTGSYNWTRSAANYNHENLLVTNQRDLVTAYLVEFDRLWKEMVVFEDAGNER
ncbi:phospholipase D-like domain-containing protein [Pontibacter ruber]|uniref:phospholipase D n=1 Tax=Pontibacter ruber TaxID=1343895 RepID=A0ABW5CVN9_9BACT|nr:phospholipase D-like domain-containing protein [Pontibacter ruber]